MKRLNLHVGVHKTGSTTLQRNLESSRPTLKVQGVEWLRAGMRDDGNHELADALITACEEDGISPLWMELLEEVQNARSSDLIVSSEAFDKLNAEHICKIQNALNTLYESVEVRIIVYLRPQAALLVSQYNQQLKEGAVREMLDQFVAVRVRRGPRWLSFRKLLEPWFEEFGSERLVVGIAEPEYLSGHSIVEDFFRAIGRLDAVACLEGPEWDNRSLNKAALAGIRDVLQSYSLWSVPFRERRPVFLTFARALRDTEPAAVGNEGPSVEMLEWCRSLYADDNKWVAEHCFGGRNLLDECYAARIETAGARGRERCGLDERLRARVRQALVWRLVEAGYADQLTDLDWAGIVDSREAR